ncbi:MAG: tetratricopeptide repeat protein [Phycisphaerae bacterium]
MAEKTGSSSPDDNSSTRYVTSAEDRVKAAKWFSRARELGDQRKFDHAIEYYVNGLAFWPDAVEEACKPLHGCAVARRQTGGKKPGLKETMKRSMNDKNAKRALMNALWLFGQDPDHIGYVEGVTRNACRLRAEDTAKWAAGVCLKTLETAPKANAKQFQTLTRLLEELGDRAAEREEVPFGVEAFQMAIEVLNLWRRRFPNDEKAQSIVKNLSTKLTILKGKYQDGDSYRESVVDSESQMELHDKHRSVQSDDRVETLIAKAEAEYRRNPDDRIAFNELIDLLCRRERHEDEAKAIGILVERYKRTGDYRAKLMADDIRIKQLGRRVRELAKAGDAAKLKEHRIGQLRFELGVFKERVERYPTDHRVRFEYAVRNFRASRFDEAIPLFQAARADPKNRAACGLYLGRCFFRKGYQAQAVSALTDALQSYEYDDDDLAKEMNYWLGRAQEASGKAEAARETYGRILQMDYNFRDVRARMEALPPPG